MLGDNTSFSYEFENRFVDGRTVSTTLRSNILGVNGRIVIHLSNHKLFGRHFERRIHETALNSLEKLCQDVCLGLTDVRIHVSFDERRDAFSFVFQILVHRPTSREARPIDGYAISYVDFAPTTITLAFPFSTEFLFDYHYQVQEHVSEHIAHSLISEFSDLDIRENLRRYPPYGNSMGYIVPEDFHERLLSYRDHVESALFIEDPKEKEEATKRATELLISYLDEDQRESFDKNKTFVCWGSESGTPYRINHKTQINVDVLNENLEKTGVQLCAVPDEKVPIPDHMLAQKIMIENDENRFLEIADEWGKNRGGWSGEFTATLESAASAISTNMISRGARDWINMSQEIDIWDFSDTRRER